MTDIIPSKEWEGMLKWLEIDIDREYDRINPNHTALCGMKMQQATIERCLKEALQREAKEAAFSSVWNKNVADQAALCGF